MLNASLYLWGTARVVGAIMHSLPFASLQEGAAFRTMGDKGYRLCVWRASALVNTNNLWYYLATLLYINVVTLMQVERLDKVFVVKGGPVYLCS